MGALAELEALGVRPSLDGERIFVRDVATLTDAARALLRSRRDEVLAELRGGLLEADNGRREALAVAVVHLAHLPAPVSLLVAVAGIRAPVVWTTSRARYAAAPSVGEVAFSPLEFEAAARAYEADRYRPDEDLLGWCTRKLRDPRWRLTELVACHGMVIAPHPRWRPTWYAGHDALGVHPHEMRHGVTVGRLLAAHRARLERVEIEQSERSAAA